MAKIDDTELEYHKQVLRQLAEAQIVVRAWGQHLSKKYNLTEKDRVMEDGEIVLGNAEK